MNPCEICGTEDASKPMVFRNERWCCDDHRKLVARLDSLDPERPEVLEEIRKPQSFI